MLTLACFGNGFGTIRKQISVVLKSDKNKVVSERAELMCVFPILYAVHSFPSEIMIRLSHSPSHCSIKTTEESDSNGLENKFCFF